MQSSFISVFGTVESALTDFVTNTKSSFKDLAISVLKQIAAMLIKMALLKAAMAAQNMGGMIGQLFGGSEFSTGATGGAFAKGAAFTSSGIAKFAKGGSFTNSIVNKTTPFAFASGGVPNMGVMGEKPGSPGEAVMPLTRTSKGDLGVAVTGGGGSPTVNIEINVASDGTSSSKTSGDTQRDARDLAMMMEAAALKVIIQQQRNGGRLASA